MVSWNPNATTFADNNTVGLEPFSVFVNTNNTVYVTSWSLDQIMVWQKRNISLTVLTAFAYPLSLFVTTAGDIYVYNIYTGTNDYGSFENNHSSGAHTNNQGTNDWTYRSGCFCGFYHCYCPSFKGHNRGPRDLNSETGNEWKTYKIDQDSTNVPPDSNGGHNQNNRSAHYGPSGQRMVNTNNSEIIMNINGTCTDLFIVNSTIYCSMRDDHQVLKKSLNSFDDILTIVAGNGSYGSKSDILWWALMEFLWLVISVNTWPDCENNRIQTLSTKSRAWNNSGGNGANGTMTLMWPTWVTLDTDGYLFIVDSGNHRIFASGPNGFRCLVGCSNNSGSASNELSYPKALSFHSYGNIFVVDTGNDRIQKFQLAINPCSKYRLLAYFFCLLRESFTINYWSICN